MAKIYIRVGHGGTDPGAENGSRKEADDILRMAKAVQPILESAGHAVKLSRTVNGTTKPIISNIVAEANTWGADYFIDIHRNSASASATGNECLVRSTSSATSKRLAQAIQKRICAVGGADRGVKTQDKNTGSLTGKMPGTIIELLFISNPNDNKLYDDKFESFARAIAQGVCDVAGGKIGGNMKSEWKKDNKGHWYRYADGSYPKSKWAKLPYSNTDKTEYWFYFDVNGYMVASTWQGDYYLKSDGAMATNSYIKAKDGRYCWVGKDGKWNGKYYTAKFEKGGVAIKDNKCAFIESVYPIVK